MEMIEKLAPYLPYKLEMKYKDNGFPIVKMANLDINGNYENWKPILRNLTDLTKEIEHNGEKFIPIKHFDEKMQSHIMDCIDNDNIDILPLYVCEYLFKWHFDVYGMIESGEAIDINTL